jgi:hypothetical protein
MLEVLASQKLEESFSDLKASLGDLVKAEELFSMAGPTFEFGESLVTVEDISKMVQGGFLKEGRVKAPPAGQTVPDPEPWYAVVFRDYFTCGLRLPPTLSSARLWRLST